MVKESAQLVSEQWRIQGKDTGGGGVGVGRPLIFRQN